LIVFPLTLFHVFQEVDRLLSENLTPEDDEDVLRELNDLKLMGEAETMEDVQQMPAVPKQPIVVPPATVHTKDVVMEDAENSTDELEGLEEMPDVPTQTQKTRKEAVLG